MMMSRSIAILFGLFVQALLVAQTGPQRYRVRFTDKGNTPFSLEQPEAYLSPRALERRQRQGIAVDSLDLPVDPAYIDALLQWGEIELVNRSRWMNAVTIRTTDTLALDSLPQAPFVAEVRRVDDGVRVPERIPDKFPGVSKSEIGTHYQEIYGASYRQVSMMNLHLLHQLAGGRGEGMLIGVLDSGFDGVDSADLFTPLRQRAGIRWTQDLAEPGGDVFERHWHGRSVLSVMAADAPGSLMGTAPKADYALLRTEFEASEFIWEEDNWIAGAEVADSLGCDVLNTSLGYTTFEDSLTDHTYSELDGQTTRISIAAGIAVEKGMVVVNSAGNSGNNGWFHIGAPADAFGILAVGAVDHDRRTASFSSRGPSADGRVKPDVAAVGVQCAALSPWDAAIIGVNGTSFSSPLVAGAAACLWQLHPDRSNVEIMDAIRRSASQWDAPDAEQGFGIPDLWRAHLLLGGSDLTGLAGSKVLQVQPVPFDDFFVVELFTGAADRVKLQLTDAAGRIAWQAEQVVDTEAYLQLRVQDEPLQRLGAGVYVLQVELGGTTLARQVVKAGR